MNKPMVLEICKAAVLLVVGICIGALLCKKPTPAQIPVAPPAVVAPAITPNVVSAPAANTPNVVKPEAKK